MTPNASVVVPVYNGERYLRDTLVSIFAQTMPDFELLVINDGSTDGTDSILAGFASDRRLRVIQRSHTGIVAALNAGVAAAGSDLIVRIDADDLMEPNRLERQLAYMTADPDLGGAGSYYRIIDERGVVCGSNEPPLRTRAELTRFLDTGGRLILPHPTMIFRRTIAMALGGYREEFRKSEDVDLFLRMVEAGHPVLIQPEYLTRFRYHQRSETARSTRQQYHLNEVIFGNHRRRAAGLPDVSVADYMDGMKFLGPLGRLRVECGVLSATLMRHRDLAKLQGRHWRAAALLGGAAALRPRQTLGKLRRKVRGIR